MDTNTLPRKLLSEREAARYLGVSSIFLRQNRTNRTKTPPFIRIGSRGVRYEIGDLDTFIERNRR